MTKRLHLNHLFVALVAVSLVLGTLSAALASEHEAVEETEGTTVNSEVTFDEELQSITIALPLDGELPECEADDDGGDESGDGEATDDAADAEPDDGAEAAADVAPDEPISYGPGDCVEFEVDHPSGKTHHGAIVSTVARNLHPSMIDGMSKGQIMRWVAKLKKVDEGDADDADLDEFEFDELDDDDDDGNGPPAHAKDKSSKGKSNNGNGKAKGKKSGTD